MSSCGRFFRSSDLILSGTGVVRFSTDDMAWRISEMRQMGQVDVAIDDVGVEVVDGLLHCSSRSGDDSIMTSERGQLGL